MNKRNEMWTKKKEILYNNEFIGMTRQIEINPFAPMSTQCTHSYKRVRFAFPRHMNAEREIFRIDF